MAFTPSHLRSALVIDQDQSQPPAAIAVLGAAGFDVHWVLDARSAHQLIRQRLVDLIVSDLYLGEDSGVELVRELRDLPAMEETPVMFLSPKQSTDVIRRAYGATGTYFLRKPVDAVVLSSLALAAVQANSRWLQRSDRVHATITAPRSLSLQSPAPPTFTPHSSPAEESFSSR